MAKKTKTLKKYLSFTTFWAIGYHSKTNLFTVGDWSSTKYQHNTFKKKKTGRKLEITIASCYYYEDLHLRPIHSDSSLREIWVLLNWTCYGSTN